MKKVESKKSSGSVLLKIALVVFVIYVVASLIGLQTKIRNKRLDYENVKNSIALLQAENEEIRRGLEVDDEAYIERYAREKLNYGRPGDSVLVDITGK